MEPDILAGMDSAGLTAERRMEGERGLLARVRSWRWRGILMGTEGVESRDVALGAGDLELDVARVPTYQSCSTQSADIRISD